MLVVCFEYQLHRCKRLDTILLVDELSRDLNFWLGRSGDSDENA